MKASDLDYVRDTIADDGFSYAFVDYSDFKEIDDVEFHKLREAYVTADKALRDYLGVE